MLTSNLSIKYIPAVYTSSMNKSDWPNKQIVSRHYTRPVSVHRCLNYNLKKMHVIPLNSVLNKRKYILSNDGESLTIFNLTKKDIMNVQCNVSNVHGYIYADSYLNVVCEYTNNL